MSEKMPKKSLGQHWLNDQKSLKAVIDGASVGPDDFVLEIGPGLGSLTKLLVDRAKAVIAVEMDEALAAELGGLVKASNLEVIAADILKFDLTQLPAGYKVVANIPYYLTANLLRILSESANPPAVISLLVQREVAERIAAKPGQMSLLSLSVQLHYQVSLGAIVPAKLFTPPPKVDSQVVMLKRRNQELFPGLDKELFFRVARAGFGEKRKKLRSSLSGGLQISKGQADELLKKAGIGEGLRAQQLSLQDWYSLYKTYEKI
jgi:16S rRNA (adenine1518-N6/adenine1519-N6)-dimethyltransferase